uniref:Uncharacterized protein n=1 Tax=Panstrongylus lignarius TaxID=156445 RepID=A0A224Y0A1_9HEMI
MTLLVAQLTSGWSVGLVCNWKLVWCVFVSLLLLMGGVMWFRVIVLLSRAKILTSWHKFITRLEIRYKSLVVVGWRRFVFMPTVALPVHSTAIFTRCIWVCGACVIIFYAFILAIALPVVATAKFAWRWWSGFDSGWCQLLNREDGHFRHLQRDIFYC